MPGDIALALDAAQAAGRLLLDRRGQADRLIAALLQRERPDDAILSEEVASVGNRATASRVWIIDPLDGTREYGMPGRPDWAVHVALWQRGRGCALPCG